MWAHPLSLLIDLFFDYCGVPLNLQQQLFTAWRVQKKILQVHEQKNSLRNSIEQASSEHASLNKALSDLSSSIALCSKKEEDLDAQVIRYGADLTRTKVQMNIGNLDFEVGTAQCAAIEEKIDGLEEEYFAVVDQREREEKERFVVTQKIKLRARAIQEAQKKEIQSLPNLNAQEEKHEEKIESLLSRVPLEHQAHFEKLRFEHNELVAPLRDSFCSACGTKQPLQIVGEVMRTTGTHICGNCKAFCIAP